MIVMSFNNNHYSTSSTLNASVIKRVNRILKNLMQKQFSILGSYKFLNIIPRLVDGCNNRKHYTTGSKPSKINGKQTELMLKSIYSQLKIIDFKPKKFKISDIVRINIHRKAINHLTGMMLFSVINGEKTPLNKLTVNRTIRTHFTTKDF